MRDGRRYENQVCRTVAQDLIGDMHAVVSLGVARLTYVGHRLESASPAPATPKRDSYKA